MTSLDRDSTRESAQVAEREQIRDSVALVVSTLLDKIYARLAQERHERPHCRPRIRGQWHKVRATIGCGPPDLDRGWFYYGLLDCTAQISALTDTNTLRHKGIFDEMKKLIFGNESQEYRWKAVSIPVLMYLKII